MLTLITGTPGAGKTLYAVSELARKIPGTTVEANGVAVPRRLLSNVRDLLVEHEQIDAAALNTWHEWAQPGDVILYDEVQEVWRPRALGKDTPPAVAALETHRHKGVDIILVTQHPMLLDSNVRRLINQHLHVRRLGKRFSMVYEWDHCSNIASLKTALQSKLWRYPVDVFALYKSAQVHTKPTARIPRVAYLGAAALVGFVAVGGYAYDRIAGRVNAAQLAATKPAVPKTEPPPGPAPTYWQERPAPSGVPPAGPQSPGEEPVVAAVATPATPAYLGCIASPTDCRCYDAAGVLAAITRAQCVEGSRAVLSVIQTGTGAGLAASLPGAARGPVPPSHKEAQDGPEAPAGGQVAVMSGAGYGLAARGGHRAP